jgi:RNA polymerase sigma-70 factor (ECF subfamily)
VIAELQDVLEESPPADARIDGPGQDEARAVADAFVLEHNRRFTAYARRFGRSLSMEDVADVAAEARLRVYKYLLQGGEVRSADGLICKAVKNALIDLLRQRQRRPGAEDGVEPDQLAGVTVNAETVALINALLMVLDPRQRQVLVMYHVFGKSHAEVAREMRISEGNSRVILHRAEKNLRRLLQGRGNPDEPTR